MSSSFPTQLSGNNFHFILNENSKKLIIFFSAKDLAPKKFNFWQIGRDLDINVLFLNNGQNEWYQRGIPDFGDTITDTIDKIKQWISALNIIETYTMGTSMGGYAAIQYGIALNAKILAFAPDVILCDEHTKSKKFLLKGITPVCSDLRTIIDNTKHTIDIMVGESDIEDLYSVSLLRKYKQVRITSLRDVDHFVPSSLTKKATL